MAASATRMVIFIIQMTIGFDLSEDGDSEYSIVHRPTVRDFTYKLANLSHTEIIALILVWSSIENGVAIVAACLPTLRLLFKHGSVEEFLKSLRSKFSLSSLRSTRTYRRTSETDSQVTMNAEQKEHFQRIRGPALLGNNVVGSLTAQGQDLGEGIKVEKGIVQHEDWV